MTLIPDDIRQTLIDNGRTSARLAGTDAEKDFAPLVKLFLPGTRCVWLITELDPECPDIAFGLADLGMGFPELGSISLSELQSVTTSLGFKVQWDRRFTAMKTLSQYADDARAQGAISA